MNESETRAELIDPKLKECGWGVEEGSKVLREHHITDGRIQSGGKRLPALKADYILVYKGIKLAVIEAKSNDLAVGEGVAQAKQYADKLKLKTAYSTNGREIYFICMETGEEKLVDNYLTPEELWNKTYPVATAATATDEEIEQSKIAAIWRDKFSSVPYSDKSGTWKIRFYQDIAVVRTLEAIANNQKRILLTLATGTGKTSIAFQIAWKLFQSRWTLNRDGKRLPRILFLADRNILANQAYNDFSAFPEDALVRIKPSEIRKKGRVPTNGSIFFTIFQTFMSGYSPFEYVPFGSAQGTDFAQGTDNRASSDIGSSSEAEMNGNSPFGSAQGTDFAQGADKSASSEAEAKYYFGEYPPDFFDFIIIDECHRGGANDESTWRGIMDYFSSAVQLGLTATPKRRDNIDTYKYFGEPVYTYSLKDGINDGFLTPFKVKRVKSTLDEYVYTSDDKILEGKVEEGKVYVEADFNRRIEIKERESFRVRTYLEETNQKDKALIFCASQDHAAMVRDLVNQHKRSKDPHYCVRVTANDGEIGEQFLRDFRDNEKTIPTILTTSHKLSTGVDARNIRNIVLLRPINSMIEFKQIVGRGTRLFDGKDYFTIFDYVDAYHHFADPEWDGEPVNGNLCDKCGMSPCECVCAKCGKNPCECVCSKCGKSPCECEPTPCAVCGKRPCECTCPECGQKPCVCQKKVKIKLKDGKEREIQKMISTSFWNANGQPIPAEEFLQNLFGKLPEFFKSEDELRTIWSNPLTRKVLLSNLANAGYGKDELLNLQKLIEAENSDLFDVLEYVVNSDIKPITREARVSSAQDKIFALLNDRQKEFIGFVLSKYIETGVEELEQEKLSILLASKYQSLEDAKSVLGDLHSIRSVFIEFQKHLYDKSVA